MLKTQTPPIKIVIRFYEVLELLQKFQTTKNHLNLFQVPVYCAIKKLRPQKYHFANCGANTESSAHKNI